MVGIGAESDRKGRLRVGRLLLAEHRIIFWFKLDKVLDLEELAIEARALLKSLPDRLGIHCKLEDLSLLFQGCLEWCLMDQLDRGAAFNRQLHAESNCHLDEVRGACRVVKVDFERAWFTNWIGPSVSHGVVHCSCLFSHEAMFHLSG